MGTHEPPPVLLENIAEASRNARKIYLLYLGVLAYGALTIISTADTQLVLNESAKLPLINVNVSLNGFFILFPLLAIFTFSYFQLYLHRLKSLLDTLRTDFSPLPEYCIYPWILNFAREARKGFLGGLQKLILQLSLWWAMPSILVLNAVWYLKKHDPILGSVVALLPLLGGGLVFYFWTSYDSEYFPKRVLSKVGFVAGRGIKSLFLCIILSFEIVFFLLLQPLALRGGGFLRALVCVDLSYQKLIREQDEKYEQLYWASFNGARLEGANFTGSILDRSDFRNASLIRAIFNNASLQRTNLSDALLIGASFDEASMDSAILKNANLRGAELKRASLRGASFREAILDSVVFNDSNLHGVDLAKVSMRGAHVNYAILDSAYMKNANCQGSEFGDTSLRGIKMDEGSLQGALFVEADLRGASITEVNLRAADLEGAILFLADLMGSKLDSANLCSARLDGADLSYVSLQAANLRGAVLDSLILLSGNLKSIKYDNAEQFKSVKAIYDCRDIPKELQVKLSRQSPQLFERNRFVVDYENRQRQEILQLLKRESPW